jgi:predicted nucleic acid-binding protein
LRRRACWTTRSLRPSSDWRAVDAGGKPKVTEEEAAKAITDYQSLALDLHPTLVLWQRVRDLSHNLSAHDAHYVALAESSGVPLVTSDARIERSGAARCAIETYEAATT